MTNTPAIHRLLPQAPDAERGVLCSLMLAPREIGALCAERGLSVAHFHLPAYAQIFELQMELWRKDQPNDFITLTNTLRDAKKLDAVGGAAFITDLFTFLPTAANAAYYIEILEEKFTLREIIKVCTEYAGRAYEEQDDVPKLLAHVEAAILKIGQQSASLVPTLSLQDHILATVNRLETMHEQKSLSGISSGFTEIDNMLDGLQRQQMIVIAARPSIGKTALAMNIAEHIAINLGKPVAVFSLEMSTSQLIDRLLCGRARVDSRQLRFRAPNQEEYERIAAASIKISNAPIIIEDDGRFRMVEQLVARARQLKQKHPDLAAIFIDYFTLLKWGGKSKSDNRTNELTEVSHALKGMAKSLDIPVVLLAQISRQYNDRVGKPQLSDLKECGALEEDADVVGFLNRDEMHAGTHEERKAAEGKAELMIRKQRSGPLGDIPLTFIKEYTRFENRAFDHDEDPSLPIKDSNRANKRR